MDPRGLSNILYELSTDMDAGDYEETKEPEVEGLAKELEKMQDSNLYRCLERIAEPHEVLITVGQVIYRIEKGFYIPTKVIAIHPLDVIGGELNVYEVEDVKGEWNSERKHRFLRDEELGRSFFLKVEDIPLY